MKNTFNIAFLKTGKWYTAFIPSIPGINTQGKTMESAQKNLMDAAKEYFEANKSLAKKEFDTGEKWIEKKITMNV